MRKILYSVKDVKVGFGVPYLCDNDAVAMRSFGVTVRQPDNLLHWCAADYALYAIGVFDDDSGMVEPFPSPRHVADASSMLMSDDKE